MGSIPVGTTECMFNQLKESTLAALFLVLGNILETIL